MMASVLDRPMLVFVTVYVVMALGVGCILELELNRPPQYRTQPQSAAIDLVTIAVQRSQ